jgi:uncharacterized membrane protein
MRASAIIILLLISVAAGVLTYVVTYVYFPRGSLGTGRGAGPQLYVWMPILVAPATFTIGLLAYIALFPEIKQQPSSTEATSAQPEEKSLAAVMRVLKDDEKKVVELLASSGGTMLQRDIAYKTGFSRVKTHRILYRLAARGIVTAKKHYNTYEISLADWLL